MVLARLLRSVGSYLAGGPNRFLAGRDLAGNAYYEYPPSHQPTSSSRHATRSRRVVKYAVERPIEEYAGSGGDAEQLPVQWKMWLRHTRADAPSLGELQEDMGRMERLKVLVEEIAERDRKEKIEAGHRRERALEGQQRGQIEHPHEEVMQQRGEEPQPAAPSQEQAQPNSTSASTSEQPRTRTRSRRGISAVPTSEVSDSDVQKQRSRRVPISVTTSNNQSSSSPATQDPNVSQQESSLLEQREADNEVWKASRERIRVQDKGGKVDSSGGRRSFVTLGARGRPTVSEMLRNRPSPWSAREYSTNSSGPIRPGRSTPPASPSSYTPPPRAPLSAQSGSDSSSSTSTTTTSSSSSSTPPPQPPRPDLPTWVYMTGAASIGLALIAVWTAPNPWALKEEQASEGGINPQRWTALKLVGSELATTTQQREGGEAPTSGDGQHKLLTLQLPATPTITSSSSSSSSTSVEQAKLRISSLSVKQPEIMIERAYTPLFSPSSRAVQEGGKIQLIVKRYADGEMGRYLHSLRPGVKGMDAPEVRGWLDTWSWKGDEPPKEILMIVGGTGVAPAHQLLDSCLNNTPPSSSSSSLSPTTTTTSSSTPASPQSPHFTLLYACPHPSSLLLIPELQSLANRHPDRLSVKLFLEDIQEQKASWRHWFPFSGGGRKRIAGFEARSGRIEARDIKEALQSAGSAGQEIKGDQDKRRNSSSRAILVCGPEAMVEAIAGPRPREIMDEHGRMRRAERREGLGGLLGAVEGVEEGEVARL